MNIDSVQRELDERLLGLAHKVYPKFTTHNVFKLVINSVNHSDYDHIELFSLNVYKGPRGEIPPIEAFWRSAVDYNESHYGKIVRTRCVLLGLPKSLVLYPITSRRNGDIDWWEIPWKPKHEP